AAVAAGGLDAQLVVPGPEYAAVLAGAHGRGGVVEAGQVDGVAGGGGQGGKERAAGGRLPLSGGGGSAGARGAPPPARGGGEAGWHIACQTLSALAGSSVSRWMVCTAAPSG